MGFIKQMMDAEKEHGIVNVLFLVQAAWMATLGISKKGYFIKAIIGILMTPILIFLGYGEFAEKIHTVAYENISTNLFAVMLLFLHYAGVIFPYLLALNVLVFSVCRMWSKEFWEKVEEAK